MNVRHLAAALLGCGLLACGGGGDDAGTQYPVAATWPPEGAHGTLSNDGGFYVTYAALPAEVPLNETFAVELRVWDAETREEIGSDAELFVDARMPAHQHGMLQEVDLTRDDTGKVTVNGMLFHMTGHWELYVDVTRGAVTERTQFDVDLE